MLQTKILAKAHPLKQINLQKEIIPDLMDAEQTWPTEEEIAMANAETKKTKLIKKVPVGMSEYQSCWIPDVEERDDDSDEDDESENESDVLKLISLMCELLNEIFKFYSRNICHAMNLKICKMHKVISKTRNNVIQ